MGLFSWLFSRKSNADGLGSSDRRLLRKGTDEELLRYARHLMDENNNEQAHQVLRRAADLHPASEDIAQLLETVEQSAIHGQIGALQSQLEENGSPEILARLAELYRRVNDIPQAMRYGREAIEMDNSSSVGYRTVGRLHLEQFRVGQASVQGINALRYLSKAHSVDPRDSRVLLNLTEIFVILGAPQAARKFLAPVLGAFPNDPNVIRLEERIRDLPNEGSTQIQDLFLRHEQRMSGEHPQPVANIELPSDMDEQLTKLSAGLMGTRGIFIVDADRSVVASHNPDGWPTDQIGESLGLLADTGRQNSNRMGVGKFTRLQVTGCDTCIMIDALGDQLCAFFVGSKGVKLTEVESLLEGVAKAAGTGMPQEVAS